ncbi:FAD-binding protein [Microtetraspora niveoalba]|uniref:FAD-binding protein n=1 Tax=Microtetraspora niveoalba TaxID=46175 RepID=UPI001FE1051A|nr:FAD-binding protein [Microtetraspora niveoalba]
MAGAVLLRTGRLDHIEVDPARRVARVGAGTRWRPLLTRAAKHGLTGLAGSSPAVSVAGFLTDGGLSWFSRGYGWAADSVRAFEVPRLREIKKARDPHRVFRANFPVLG